MTEIAEAAKLWLPSCYQGDDTPMPRESPDAWIVHTGQAWCMAPAHLDIDGQGRPLREGQVVNFQWHATLEDQLVLRFSDKPSGEPSWTVRGNVQMVPATASVFMFVEDTEQVFDNLADLVKTIDPYQSATVKFYCWSADIPFTFHEGAFHMVGTNG